MQPFVFAAARDEADAIARAAAGARYIAGGTTLIDLMREGVERPSAIVDINGLALRDISASRNLLSIGALARMSDVAVHPEVARRQPLIVQALLEGASPQLRNMATVGGNVLQRVRCPYFRATDAACNKRQPGSGCAAIGGFHANQAIFGTSEHCIATHPSDLAVALVALDARVCVRGPRGERYIPLDDLYRLPEDTPHLEHTLEPAELIVSIDVPCRRPAHRGCYLKVRDRASYEFAVVSVAVDLDIEDGVIRAARLAAGGVGTKPWRLRGAELAITGEQPGHSVWTRAGAIAIAGATPLAGNTYKVELLRRTVVRALQMAAETP
jgi:xanthine dehydrogenase YagS FAD-binding subunit